MKLSGITLLQTTPETWEFSKRLNAKLKEHPDFVENKVEFRCGLVDGKPVTAIAPIDLSASKEELQPIEIIAQRIFDDYAQQIVKEMS